MLVPLKWTYLRPLGPPLRPMLALMYLPENSSLPTRGTSVVPLVMFIRNQTVGFKNIVERKYGSSSSVGTIGSPLTSVRPMTVAVEVAPVTSTIAPEVVSTVTSDAPAVAVTAVTSTVVGRPTITLLAVADAVTVSTVLSESGVTSATTVTS